MSESIDAGLKYKYPLENVTESEKEIVDSMVAQIDAHIPESNSPKLHVLRIATQIREIAIQGVTLKNTFGEMEEVWLSLYDKEKRCPIVEQGATKVKYQLVNLYAIKLIRYLNSIVGLDLVPMAQQDPATRTWKLDAIILNIAGNKVNDHAHLFRMLLVNLYGVSEDQLDMYMELTPARIQAYVQKTYGYDLGDTTNSTDIITIEQTESALNTYLSFSASGYHLY